MPNYFSDVRTGLKGYYPHVLVLGSTQSFIDLRTVFN